MLFRSEQSYSQTGVGFAGSRPLTTSSETVTTYLANARYKFSSRATAYVRFATGYRPGGPNFVSPVVASPATFEADSLQSYEIGFKRSEEHTSELQSLIRSSYAVFCLKK